MKAKFILVFLSLLWMIAANAQNPKVSANPSDSLELVDIYNSTQGNSWTHNDAWLTDSVYKWYGVTINDQGRVIALDLTGNNLTGNIPEKIGYLTELRSLKLASNHLSGNIPTGIGDLSKLQYLNLAYNNLSGNIPAEIGNLDSLQKLELEHNSLSGSIPPAIGNLSVLTRMDLSYNQLSDAIPPEIGNLDSLKWLDLSFNQLSILPSEIGNLSNLEVLKLNDNQLHCYLPSSLDNLHKLQILDLHNNELFGEIKFDFSNMSGLTNLDLSHNHFYGDFSASIGLANNLTDLNISYNQFTGTIYLLKAFASLGNANFSHNLFQKLEMDGIQPLSNLFSVDVSYNNLSEFTLKNPGGFSNLGELVLSHNHLDTLPDLSGLSGLFRLDVDNNKLDFGDLQNANPTFYSTYAPQAKIGHAELLGFQAGENVQLSVNVSGTNNQYQWYKDGAPISGATYSTLIINNYNPNSDNGIYYCEITNSDYPDLHLYSCNKYLDVPRNTYNIDIVISPAGAAAHYSGDGSFADGEADTLRVTPNPTWRFAGWIIKGEYVSSDFYLPLVVSADCTITAQFIPDTTHYTVVAYSEQPQGGSVTGGGSYQYGQVAHLEANPNPGWDFSYWCLHLWNITACSSSSTMVDVFVDGDYTYSAQFTQKIFNVNLTADPSDGGSVSGGGQYNYNDQVPISATANPGYSFDKWTDSHGNVVSTNPDFTLTVKSDTDLIAHFTQNIYNVTLSAVPAEGGSVSGEGQYYYNDVVQVNATPNNGYTFLHWEDLSGNTVSTQASFYLTVVSDTTLYAIFGAQNTGIASIKDNINIYPNPASSILNITGKDIDITSVVITNILGKEEPVKIIRSDADRVSLSVKDIPPGIYLLKILTSSGRYINKRLIIK